MNVNNPHPLSLEHIAWQVADPAGMAQWYVRHLGFRILHRVDGPAEVHFLSDSSGGTVIELYRVPDLEVPDYASMHPLTNHIAVSIAEPELVRDRLLAEGASLVSDFPAGNASDRLAMLRDPWGLPLQLVHRRKKLSHFRVLCLGQEALAAACHRARLLPVGFLDPFASGGPVPERPDGCAAFHDLEAALNGGAYDLALVVVPNFAKNDFGLEERIIRAGIPVACTKLRPMSWADPETIAAAVAERGIPYFCNDHYHRSASFLTAKQRIAEIGRIQSVHFRCALPSKDTGFAPWTASYRHLVLEDLAYHHLSTLTFLAGPFKTRDAWCASRALGPDGLTKNDVQYLAAMQEGWVLNYSARWGTAGSELTSWPGEFRFEGEQGSLFVSRESVVVNGQRIPPDEMAAPIDWLDEVLDCLSYGTQPRCLARLKDYLPIAEAIRIGVERASASPLSPCSSQAFHGVLWRWHPQGK